MKVLHRILQTAEVAGGRLLAAVPDGDAVISYFGSGFPADRVAGGGPVAVGEIRQIGGGLAVTASAEVQGDAVPLPLHDLPMVAVTEPERHLFRGLRTALALRGTESPEVIKDWLRYHARHHGLEAALILDRRSPEPSALPQAFKSMRAQGLRRLMVLQIDAPTGHPDTGDEALPYLAPDAPGKDRMKVPHADPWRAPFGEMILYELIRQLWLGEARAVMNVDLSDLVRPLAGGSVFDLAEGAPGGVARLIGTRVYPWGLRPGADAGFADHICHRFDGTEANPRWCVAPAKAPETCTWRMVRIAGIGDAPQPVARYWRCMALRHPTEKISQIVPKTSLVEDAELVNLLSASFAKAKPLRPPPTDLTPAAARQTNRTGIVTTMKNEGPFILEWLAYHRAIGVEEFLIYTNDCTDGTDSMLALLDRKGLVHHRENPFREMEMKPQHGALHAADAEAVVRGLDWVICMDVDEFINIHAGDGRLEDLYAAVPDANMISMTWRLFGNADVHAFEDRFIVEQFNHCAPHFARKPHQAWGFKTAARNNGIFKKLGVHRPKGLRPQLVDELNWVNGSGAPMPRAEYRNAWRSTVRTYGYDLVTLNHYAVRSAESFLVKRDRGRVNHVDRDQGLVYWFRMNNNAEEDRSIQRMIPALREEFDRLCADPEIAAAHAAAVAAHRAKIAELKATEKYSAFYREITSDRLSRLSRMHAHFGSEVFHQGPDCIPDEVFGRFSEPDFFFTVPKAADAG